MSLRSMPIANALEFFQELSVTFHCTDVHVLEVHKAVQIWQVTEYMYVIVNLLHVYIHVHIHVHTVYSIYYIDMYGD